MRQGHAVDHGVVRRTGLGILAPSLSSGKYLPYVHYVPGRSEVAKMNF